VLNITEHNWYGCKQGHEGIDGNEMADQLAKPGSECQFIVPEPAWGSSLGVAKKGAKEAKVLIQRPSVRGGKKKIAVEFEQRPVRRGCRTTRRTLPPKRTPFQSGTG
jgi:hypothetical protein